MMLARTLLFYILINDDVQNVMNNFLTTIIRNISEYEVLTFIRYLRVLLYYWVKSNDDY